MAPVDGGHRDGSERALLAVLEAVRDRSVASPELAEIVQGSAGLHHLSAYRATLFDALGLHGAHDAAALEVGAGCGAITRWLGEHVGRVDAVEHSVERATVAAARCADLDNVSVFSTAPATLEEVDAYDLVTMVGVLEYADVDRLAALRAARAALHDDSLLVLAMENRLGLKYLNGALEDHSGKVYDSVHGYPAPGAAVTFSLRELELLVREAGFDHVDVLLPFPDYKLASTIIDPRAFDDDLDAANWLLGTAPNRRVAPRRWSFSETLAQREVVRAGLLSELSNSLVLLAYRGDPERAADRLGIERGWAARHWSLDRRPACRKRVTLTAEGAIVNELAAGGPAGRGATIDLGLFEHRLAVEPRRRGPLVVFEALEALVAEGVGPRLLAHVRTYAAWLEAELGTGRRDADGVALLRGDALDAIWVNLIDDRETGRWQAVDREWAFRGELPVDYLVWRAIADLRWRFAAELPEELRALTPDVMAYDIACEAGVMAGPERLVLARELEAAFHAAAGTGATPVPGPRVQALADARERRGRFRILARAEELIASPSLLRAYARTFAGAALATLVLFSTAGPEANLPALQSAIVAADLDEDTMPDTVLVDADADPEGAAVFTATGWGPPDLDRFGPDELPALRALAEQRWAENDNNNDDAPPA
jgi:precorrin-6B methylase 2